MSPPQTKRRKTAVPRSSTEESSKPTLLSDIIISRKVPGPSRVGQHVHAERERGGSRPMSASLRDAEARITGTPARHDISRSQGLARLGLNRTPRMLATPAPRRARTIQERVIRPSPGTSQVDSPYGTARPRLQKHASVKSSVISRTTSTIPSRSISRVSARTTQSFPGVALGDTDSDSDDSSNEDFKISKPTIVKMGSRPPPLGHRAARKSAQQARVTASQKTPEPSNVGRDSLISSDITTPHKEVDEEEDDLYVDADPAEILDRIRQANAEARVPRSPSGEEMPNELEDELTDLLRALIIRDERVQSRGRLPFLRRNLRKSMDNLNPSKWQGHEPDAVRSHDFANVEVNYILSEYESPGGSFSGKWFCPLCPIKLWFNTRGALDTHIYKYHTECTHEWSDKEDNSLLLKIILPDVPETESEIEEEKGLVKSSEEELSSDDEESVALRMRTPPSEDKPFLRGSSVLRAQTVIPSPPSKIYPSSPRFSPVGPFRPISKPAESAISRPARPIDPFNPERYPTPPPFDDLEGPAAVYPYIPEDSYSARPGGPKVYDILSELSLEPFGLMAGYIAEREDDIFELDYMRDEDKVMLVLWNRWIFINRQKFIENYEKGINSFIDEYWRIIHRAAGFSALRTWILVLVENRYLTGAQFCDALKYYKDLVGTDQWSNSGYGDCCT